MRQEYIFNTKQDGQIKMDILFHGIFLFGPDLGRSGAEFLRINQTQSTKTLRDDVQRDDTRAVIFFHNQCISC